MKSMIIQDYNLQWAREFESLKCFLTLNLESEIIKIEHEGSTSVIGMKAKPILDLDIIIENNDDVLKWIINKLRTLGCVHFRGIGISGRDAFKRTSSKTPFSDSKKVWFEHNLYVCKKRSIGLLNHLALKKHLADNPSKIIEYSNLKLKQAKKFPNDIDSFIDGKTDFILNILKENVD
jgi:GrpB-like predicted nucleotidyltransferase (UPF0157 family)